MSQPESRAGHRGGDRRGVRGARPLALVALGGALGTALRVFTSAILPTPTVAAAGSVAAVPLATAGVNLVGSLVLGLLTGWLAARGPDTGARRDARLLLGTGLCGGFTTYSSFTVETAQLLGAHGGAATTGAAVVGVLYALITVVAGALAAWFGLRWGAALGAPR